MTFCFCFGLRQFGSLTVLQLEIPNCHIHFLTILIHFIFYFTKHDLSKIYASHLVLQFVVLC